MKHKKNSFLDLLEAYFNTYLPVAKGLSTATVTSYKATFRILIEFMYTVKGIPAEKIYFEILDAQMITEFLDWLESERKCSIATRNQRLSALSAFSIYAQNRDFGAAYIFRNNVLKVPKKKAPQSLRSSFSREEVKILFKLPDANTEIGLRNKTLLCFMYASGMRSQEVCDLTVGDIQFYQDKACINVHGKGQKIRRIGIPAAASDIVKKYIAHRGISEDKNRHIFSSQIHEKMTVSCIEEIYAKYIRIAKQENPGMFRNNYTPHSMRHYVEPGKMVSDEGNYRISAILSESLTILFQNISSRSFLWDTVHKKGGYCHEFNKSQRTPSHNGLSLMRS